MLDAPDFLNNNMLICQEIRACAARPVRARRRRLEPRWCLFRLTLPPPRARGARGDVRCHARRRRRSERPPAQIPVQWYTMVRAAQPRPRPCGARQGGACASAVEQAARQDVPFANFGRRSMENYDAYSQGLSGSSPHAPRCVQTNTRRGVFVPRSSVVHATSTRHCRCSTVLSLLWFTLRATPLRCAGAGNTS